MMTSMKWAGLAVLIVPLLCVAIILIAVFAWFAPFLMVAGLSLGGVVALLSSPILLMTYLLQGAEIEVSEQQATLNQLKTIMERYLDGMPSLSRGLACAGEKTGGRVHLSVQFDSGLSSWTKQVKANSLVEAVRRMKWKLDERAVEQTRYLEHHYPMGVMDQDLACVSVVS